MCSVGRKQRPGGVTGVCPSRLISRRISTGRSATHRAHHRWGIQLCEPKQLCMSAECVWNSLAWENAVGGCRERALTAPPSAIQGKFGRSVVSRPPDIKAFWFAFIVPNIIPKASDETNNVTHLIAARGHSAVPDGLGSRVWHGHYQSTAEERPRFNIDTEKEQDCPSTCLF